MTDSVGILYHFRKSHMEIFSGDYSAKLRREDAFEIDNLE
jgi:hypothetical protein